LKCAVGVDNDDHRLVSSYRRLLEREIIERPRSLALVERVLAPVLGKSEVHYAVKGDPSG
jgi:hypothetical protein